MSNLQPPAITSASLAICSETRIGPESQRRIRGPALRSSSWRTSSQPVGDRLVEKAECRSVADLFRVMGQTKWPCIVKAWERGERLDLEANLGRPGGEIRRDAFGASFQGEEIWMG